MGLFRDCEIFAYLSYLEVLIYTKSHPATRYSYLLGQKVPHALMCLFSGNLLVGVDLIRR